MNDINLPTPTSELPVEANRPGRTLLRRIRDLQDVLGFYPSDVFLKDHDEDRALDSAAGQMQLCFSQYVEHYAEFGEDSAGATDALEELVKIATRTLQQRRDRISPKCPPVPEVPALFPDLTPMDMNQ